MNSIQCIVQHDNKTTRSTDVRSPKLRDASTRSEATSSTVSSSMSDCDIEEIDTFTTTSSFENDGITCNTNITFSSSRNCCDENNDDDSVVSHVSSLSGHMPKSAKPSKLYDATDNRQIPLLINRDVHDDIINNNNNNDDDDDDELSFAPLDEGDEDSTGSFAPLEDDDDDNDDETRFEAQSDPECPSDEEGNVDDENVVYRKPDRTTKHKIEFQIEHAHYIKEHENTATSVDDVNCFNEKQFIQQKTLPGLNNSYKVVCVSFMEYNIATSVACKVLDESLRMLRPGGLLYVIDKGGGTVKKHPTMRQWLSRVRDPTVKHLIYEIETRAVLQANGFVHRKLDENNDTAAANTDDGDWEDEEIVRWIGIKQ